MNYVADKAKVYTRVVYLCLPRVQDGFEFFRVIRSRFSIRYFQKFRINNR